MFISTKYDYLYQPLFVIRALVISLSIAASENIKISWPSRKQIVTKDNVTPNPKRKLNFYSRP